MARKRGRWQLIIKGCEDRPISMTTKAVKRRWYSYCLEKFTGHPFEINGDKYIKIEEKKQGGGVK